MIASVFALGRRPWVIRENKEGSPLGQKGEGTIGSFLEAGPPLTPLESRKRKAPPMSPEEKRGSSESISALYIEEV